MDKNTGLIFKYRVWWHILFWVMCYLFYVLTYGAYNDNYDGEFKANLYIMPIRIIGTYLLVYLIIPELLLKRRYTLFAVTSVIHVILYGMGVAYIIHKYIFCITCVYPKDFPFGMRLILESIASNYEIPAIAVTIKLFKIWYLDKKQNQELEKEKLEAELKLLKSQIHPHFLFNTLNNLYALTLKKDDKAPDMVLKISNMLDYMLYHSNEKEVDLEKEIYHIADYIELEKLRYGNRLNLSYDCTGETQCKKIAPLILLPFVENSFKHGVSSAAKNIFVDIKIVLQEKCLNMKIINSYDPAAQTKDDYCEGIGLKNVRRRLELLYPGRHTLNIDKNNENFKVELCIKWTELNEKCEIIEQDED